MKKKLIILLLLCCFHFANSDIFDPIRDLYCNTFECCNSKTVPYNLQSLKTMLETKLYGQHIAAEVVLNAINNQVRNSKSSGPLVMSFHGANGGGKSYVSRMIAKAFYKHGENSQYFHFYYGLQDFPSIDENEIAEYRKRLNREIQAAINSCEKSLIVLDGVDYMPPDLLDAIMPFIDCSNCGNKNQKSIFILLSNTGSKAIEKKVLEEMDKGTKRKSLSLKDFEETIIKEVYSHDGPFYKSKLIKSEAIAFYVPFLPLEKEHVKKCIIEDFMELNFHPTQELVDEVMKELIFGPDDKKLFSKSGCKRVEKIVGRVHARLNPSFNDFDNDEL